jgi:hypothetical protein
MRDALFEHQQQIRPPSTARQPAVPGVYLEEAVGDVVQYLSHYVCHYRPRFEEVLLEALTVPIHMAA